MSRPEQGERSEQLQYEWSQLIRRPLTTDPVVRCSQLSEERAVDLAQEQQVYAQRYRTRTRQGVPNA